MSDDEPNAVGPSPAKSVARSAVSVASTRKSTKESAVQAKVAAMSRPELEDGMIKLLTKLQAKEKLIKELTPAATAAAPSSLPLTADREEKHQQELQRMEETMKGLKDQLKQQQVAFDNEKRKAAVVPPPSTSGSLESWRDRAVEAESKLATAEGQVMTLIQASKDTAMAHGEQLDEMTTELQQARLALEESQKVTQEMREKELMYQQQLGSLKEALRDLGAEREAAFVSLSEFKEQAVDQAAEMNEKLNCLHSDLDSKRSEVSSLTRQLEASSALVKSLEENGEERRESSPGLYLPPPPQRPSQLPQEKLTSLAPIFDILSSIETAQHQAQSEAISIITNKLMASIAEIKRLQSMLKEAIAAKEEKVVVKEDDEDQSSLILAKENEIKTLVSELADTKKKLLAAAKKGVEEAKKRDHENKETEVKISGLSSKHKELTMEVAKLRLESEELSLLKAEKLQLVSNAASKQKELEQAQSLMQEYKQLASQKDNGASQALAKAEAEVKRLQVEMERALSKVESRLHEKELDCEGLLQQLSKAEKEASDLRRALEGKASGAVAELQAAKVDAETSKVELLAVKKELEVEKQRAAKALDEAKKRMNKAQKLQHAAELELAESRGKAVAEREGGKLEAALANQALETCRRDMERLDAELKDYKSRAQALLKHKDTEIKEARESLALTMVPIEKLAEIEARLASSDKALNKAIALREEIEENLAQEMDKERSTHSSIVEKLEGRVKYFETLCTNAQKELDELRNKYQSLEARLLHHQSVDHDAGLAAVKDAEEARRLLAEALSELECTRDDLRSFKASSEEMMEVKDAEMLQLVRRHTLLHEELTSVKEQLTTLVASQAAAISQSSDRITSKRISQEAALAIGEDKQARPEEGWENAEGWSAGSLTIRPQSLVTPPTSSLPLGSSSGGGGLNILETLVSNPGLNAPHGAQDEDLRELISSSDVFGEDGGLEDGRSTVKEAEMALALIKLVKELFDETSKASTLLSSPRVSSSALDLSQVGLATASSLSAAFSFPSLSQTDKKASEYEAAMQHMTRLQSIVKRNQEVETELLEMEKELKLREEMEAALKESLREAERLSVRHSRSTIDVEYLKNTILKMYRTGDAEQLLPVFAMILAFGPEELKSCQMGLQALREGTVPLPAAAAAVDATLMGATSVLSFLWGGSSSSSGERQT